MNLCLPYSPTYLMDSTQDVTTDGASLTPAPFTATRKRKRTSSQGRVGREFGLMRQTGEDDRARFVGSGSGIHYIRAVYLRLAKNSALRANGTTASNLVPGEDDQLRGDEASTAEGNLWKEDEVCSASDTNASSRPKFDELVEWSKSYFHSWHPALPFLDGPSVLRIFEDATTNGTSSLSTLEYAILRSVLSISVADSRQGSSLSRPLPSYLVFQTIDEAVSASQFALSQPASLIATQAALSIQLFLVSMLRLNAASRLGGLIVRMAFHLGLHRCPARFAFFTPDEVYTRQRIFWCIYILERLLCQSLGLPLDIQDDDIDICYPGEERHGKCYDDNQGLEKLQLLVHIAKHARIRGLILELRNKSINNRQDTEERTSFVHLEFSKWCNEVQDIIENDCPESSLISTSHRLVLLLLKHESTICLYRPGMAGIPSGTGYSSALQACVAAAKSIFIALRKHLHQNGLQQQGRLEIPLLWPSSTWTIWISAFVLLHAASEGQVSVDNAIRHVQAGKEALQHISTRNTAWPDYCCQAVGELTNTVKELFQPDGRQLRDVTASPAATRTGSEAFSIAGSTQTVDSVPEDTGIIDNHLNGHEKAFTMGISPSRSLRRTSTQMRAPSSAAVARPQQFRASPSRRPSQSLRQGTRTHLDTEPISQVARGDVAIVCEPSLTTASASRSQDPLTTWIPDPDNISGDSMSMEGYDSFKWYDQLFQSSFSAIDNPLLASAEFDGSIDPIWNYLGEESR